MKRQTEPLWFFSWIVTTYKLEEQATGLQNKAMLQPKFTHF